ncbi:nuclear transport factor 2 family protein [Natronoglycomyces albus]|uniref:Nuclear transport factor 2 family protein n=1 Tax=Natronoglycomyces albus TaxID=2811108 RepID=A0A895XQS0_9ACTN|nr:nuclear transport factor 2 family protein [Natronoglycomyces albus]QSB04620.1 nuclear transport factor 2 family protein [Natronoglycomyces albus]
MSTSEELIHRHVASFNAADPEALLVDFTPDATWVTGQYTVPEGQLREFFTTAMEGLTPHLRLHRIIDGGDTVAAEMTETWTHEGNERTAALIAVFDVVDGKIARAKIYREGSADA